MTDTITIDNVSDFFNKDIAVHVLRLDRIDPVISGNKWFKLRYYLEDALAKQQDHIITFGGAWSNHIIATAAACGRKGLRCTGIIRGEQPAKYSPTLELAANFGMKFHFLARDAYRDRVFDPLSIDQHAYIIPEGGFGILGAMGASTILETVGDSYTHICCAIGTGTTIAGLINASGDEQSVIGISALRNNKDLEPAIAKLLTKSNAKWELCHDYHFGGYARHRPELLTFMNDFYLATGIPTDFVYTGKLLFAVKDLSEKNFFPQHSKLLVIHSGGLQDNASLPTQTLIF